MIELLRKVRGRLLGYHPLREQTARALSQIAAIEINREWDRLRQRSDRSEPRRLTRHDSKVFSQFGEDGITAEIFRRIGKTNEFFVEFGVGNGRENNTVYLLTAGWKGLWIEIDERYLAAIRSTFATELVEGRLSLLDTAVTASNVEHLFSKVSVPDEPDLLSIDIDGNDFYVWTSIVRYRPRVVIIEYNSLFPPSQRWRMQESSVGVPITSYFGASLLTMTELAERKGYKLVACSLSGANAFYVRNDLVSENNFAAPFTAENHYEPPRYYLYQESIGHAHGFGPAVLE